MEPTFKSYEDWYDHGPGSESFKRECRNAGKAMTLPIKRVRSAGEIFREWAEEYWSKPLLMENLLEEDRKARIRDLILKAKDIVVFDSMLRRDAHITRELAQRRSHWNS